jgi:hypothetical protein
VPPSVETKKRSPPDRASGPTTHERCRDSEATGFRREGFDSFMFACDLVISIEKIKSGAPVLRNSPLSAGPRCPPCRAPIFSREESHFHSLADQLRIARPCNGHKYSTLPVRSFCGGPVRKGQARGELCRAWSRAWSAATKGATPCHLGRVSRSLSLNLVVRCCSALWHGTTIRHSHGH